MHSNKMKTYELTLTETQKRWINQHCLIHLFSSIIQDPNSSLMCFFSIGQGHLCLDKIKVLLVKMEEGGKIDVRQPNAPATLLVKSMVISSYPTSLPAHKKGRGPERLLGKRKWNQQSKIKTRKKNTPHRNQQREAVIPDDSDELAEQLHNSWQQLLHFQPHRTCTSCSSCGPVVPH